MINDQSHVSDQCTAYQILLQFVVVSWPSHMWHLDGFSISTQLTLWSVESLMNHTPVQFSTVRDSLLSSSLAGPVALCSPTPAHVRKTQCKIEFTYASHCVSKNLTPRRMLKTSFLIAQIIGWNNSFQNIYDMLWAKVDHLAGKTYFVKKNT